MIASEKRQCQCASRGTMRIWRPAGGPDGRPLRGWELPLAMLTRIEQQLRPKIKQVRRALVPPITNAHIRILVTAADVRAAWAELSLAEQRKIVKAVFDVHSADREPGQERIRARAGLNHAPRLTLGARAPGQRW